MVCVQWVLAAAAVQLDIVAAEQLPMDARIASSFR
jgi:hypothetical protein